MNMSAFGAPGLLNVFEANLRTAVGKSAFTQDVIDNIGQSDGRARDFLSGVQGEESPKPLWRTPEDVARFKQYDKHIDLYFNRHEKHLKPDWLPTGKMFYKRYNWCRFVTKIYVSLMLGGGVEVKTGNEAIDDYIEDTVQLPRFFADWATSASIVGMVGLQIVIDDDNVDIIMVDPRSLFWDWKQGTTDDFEWIAKKVVVDPRDVVDPSGNWQFDPTKNGDKIDGIIFEERHHRGAIEYFLYTYKGDEIAEMLDVRWFDDTLPALNEENKSVQETECDEFLLQVVPNVLFMNQFVSDYEDIEDIQASINLRATQRSRILNVHADPKLMLPEGLQQKDPYTGEVVVRGLRDEVLFLAPEDYMFKPEYLTWDAQLDHVTKELEDDQAALCTFAEIAPTLVVGRDEAFPESGAAYKMKLTSTLNHVNDKEKDFKKALQVLIHTYITKLVQQGLIESVSPLASPLDPTPPKKVPGQFDLNAEEEGPIPTTVDSATEAPQDVSAFMEHFKPSDITLDFKPALPQDEKLLIERLGGAQSISRKRVLKLVDGLSDQEIQEELDAIDNDTRQVDETAFGVGMDDIVSPDGLSTPPPPDLSGGLGMTPGQASTTDTVPSGMI